MTTPHEVAVTSWEHKDLFKQRKDYDDPFFSLCTHLDVTQLVNHVEAWRFPLPLCLSFLSQRVANQIDNLRYRIIDEEVVIMDQLHSVITSADDGERLDFCFLEHADDFYEYLHRAGNELERHNEVPRSLRSVSLRYDVIHYSMLTSISFSNLKRGHNRKLDSIPKIVFGKHQEEAGSLRMPVAIEVHHALVDGVHVAQYLDKLQQYLNQPQLFLVI